MTIYYQKAKQLLKEKPLDIKVGRASNPNYTYTLKEKVYKEDYIDMLHRFTKYCEENHKYPNYVLTKQSKTPSSIRLFCYCINKIEKYYKENNRLPNYCIFDYRDVANTTKNKQTSKNNSNQSTSNSKKTSNSTNLYISSPHYTSEGCNKLGQCTPYYCGPHSIHQAIRKFGITQFTEKQIAAWAATTTAGTDHNGINTAIAKISKETGKKLTTQWLYFSDLGKTPEERFEKLGKLISQPNKALITHIKYINGGKNPATSNATSNNKGFGHYETLDKINTETRYVRALNSLNIRKSDGSYTGTLQDRTFNTEASYLAYTPGGQKAICIITLG